MNIIGTDQNMVKHSFPLRVRLLIKIKVFENYRIADSFYGCGIFVCQEINVSLSNKKHFPYAMEGLKGRCRWGRRTIKHGC